MKEKEKKTKEETQKEKINPKKENNNSNKLIRIVIGVICSVVFLSMIGITGLFALRDTKNIDVLNIDNKENFNGSMPSMPEGNMPNGGSFTPPERSDEENDSENSTSDKEESTNDDTTNSKGKRKSRKSSSTIEDFSDKFERKEIKSSSGIKLIYVILLMLESLFLGASLMYIILSIIR